jgi:transcription elongation GreA/GreB family factor
MALDDSVEMDVYSPQSPLGSALLGKRPASGRPTGHPTARCERQVVDAKPFIA